MARSTVHLKQAWLRLTGPFREFGVVVGLLYVTDRVLRAISPRVGLLLYDLVAQPIVGRDLLPPALSRNLHFEELGPGHPDLARLPIAAQVREARLAGQARCLAAYRKGVMLGSMWWCCDRYFEQEASCLFCLPPGVPAVFDFDLYVVPEQRMGMGFMAIWQGTNGLLRQQGVRIACSRISRFNSASARAHARIGARVVGRVLFLRAGPLSVMGATCAPYLSVSVNPERPIVLTIDPGMPLRAEMEGASK